MTANQNQANANREEKRANRERERENFRSNRAREHENERHNRRTEQLKTAEVAVKGVETAFRGLSSAANDPRWYAKNPQLVKDVASISFHAAIGTELRIWNEQTPVYPSVPGILAIECVLAISVENVASSAVNVAAKNIYSWVRHANSGSKNYEPVDLMLYLLAIDSAYSLAAALMRLYSVLREAKAENRYYPQAYVQACGCNWSNLRLHVNDLRARINQLLIRLTSFYVPKGMPLFERHLWMFGSIFKDSPVKRSSEYLFNPTIIYKYVEGESTSQNYLQGIWGLDSRGASTPSLGLTFEDIDALIEAVIEPLISSEDIGIISGDIKKAYGDNLYTVSLISEDYHVESVYSPEVLTQINGATLAGPLADPDGGLVFPWIKQFGSTLVMGNNGQSPSTAAVNLYPHEANILTEVDGSQWFVNMYKDDVTPDDVMVATRLASIWDTITPSGTDSVPYRQLKTCGTEFCAEATMYWYNTQHVLVGTKLFDGKRILLVEGSSVSLNLTTTLYNCFDWAPCIRLSASNATGGLVSPYVYCSLDVCNIAIITQDMLKNMHAVAALSEYNVPIF